MKRRTIFLLIISLLGSLVVAQLSSSASKDTLIIATHTFGSEDWLGPMRSTTENYITVTIYNSLLTRSDTDGSIVAGQGGLAKSFSMSDDGRTFTFDLVKGAQFHEGYGEVTAGDVKYSFELATLVDSTNDAAGVFRNNIDRIEIVNPYRLIVYMKIPFWDMANYLTETFQYLPIVCKAYVEKVGKEKAGRHPIGSNNYQFKEHVVGDRIAMTAVAKHWYRSPKISNIVFKKVPEPVTRLAMLKTGEAHLIQIMYDQIKEVQKAGLKVKAMKDVTQPVIHLFGQYLKATYKLEDTPPWAKGTWWELDSPAFKVRKALSLAIDRQSIVDNVLMGYGSVKGATAVAYFPGSPGWDPNARTDLYDPKRALELLKEAGYKNPSDLKITADLTPHAARPYNKPIMEAVAMMWESLGISVKTRMATDYPSLMGDTAARRATYAWAYALPLMGEAYSFLQMHTSKSHLSFVGESPEYDRRMDAIAQAKKIQERNLAHRALFDYMHEHLLTIPICFASNLYALSSNLVWLSKPGQAGVMMHNFDLMYFE